MGFNKSAEKLKDYVKGDRYDHSLSVAKLAARLAEANGLDAERARLAGLLHDVAKQASEADFRAALAKGEVACDAETLANPGLHHALHGALLARREFGVEDEEILAAIEAHTTGAAGMSPLGLALYVADFCEEGRGKGALEAVREAAAHNLLEAALEVCEMKIAHLLKKRRPIHSRAIAFYNDLLRRNAAGAASGKTESASGEGGRRT